MYRFSGNTNLVMNVKPQCCNLALSGKCRFIICFAVESHWLIMRICPRMRSEITFAIWIYVLVPPGKLK